MVTTKGDPLHLSILSAPTLPVVGVGETGLGSYLRQNVSHCQLNYCCVSADETWLSSQLTHLLQQ